MKAFKDQPIARKALLLGVVPTVVVILLVILSSVIATYVQARTNMVSDLEAEASLVGDNVSAALAFNDQKTAADTLNAFRSKTNIDAVCVYDIQGRLFASFTIVTDGCAVPAPALEGGGATYILEEQDVLLGGRKVGEVRVRGNFSRLYEWTRRQSLVGLGTFIVGVLLSLVLTRDLSRAITRPLQNLAATADRVSTGGDYGVRAIRETDDEVGRMVGSFNGMLDHIQEQRNASARLLEREQEASRLKDQFLAAVSHELRTPLNAILGWLQIIRTTNPGTDTVARGLDSLERNALAQARVVEDLIEISRVVTGKLQLKLGLIDLRNVVKAALEVVDPALKAKGVRVSQALPAARCPVSGDPDRLQQVIWNLFSNAVKFTPAGGAVTVDLTEAGGEFALTVSDTGVGISAEFMPFVFDRFRQADGSMTREHGGLGLGLAIAKELTELHGGTLRAASAGRDKGATFVLRLPRLAGAKAQVGEIGDAAARSSQNVLDGIRVLAVDDDPDALEVIAEGLRSAGAGVQTALSGAEAIDAWRSGRFDVLVCDLAMPHVDGFTVVKEIRRLPGSTNGRFAIALSAHSRQEDRQRALEAGFHLHLGKPFDLQELINAVRTSSSDPDAT